MRLFLDCETYSSADLKRCGAHAYARHPSTVLLMIGYQVDDEVLGPAPVALWDVAAGAPMPEVLRSALGDEEVLLYAFNANFEMALFDALGVLAFAPARWRCVQALALSYGLPGSLAGVCDALELGPEHAKLTEGPRLLRTFCVPQAKDGRRILPADNPEAWERLGAYCCRDVVAARHIVQRLTA